MISAWNHAVLVSAIIAVVGAVVVLGAAAAHHTLTRSQSGIDANHLQSFGNPLMPSNESIEQDQRGGRRVALDQDIG